MELSIAFLIGLSCFIGLILLYLKREFSDYVRTIDLIPGPKKTPVLGNITYVAPWKNSDLANIFHVDLVQQYGRIYRVWVGFRVLIGVSSADMMEKVLTSQKFINKGDIYDALMPWLGTGLLLASGKKWRTNRRLLTPAFHFQILDSFFHVFNQSSDILCDQLAKALRAEDGSPKELDVFPFLKRCTLDIICETAMGIRINAQLEDSEYIRGVKRLSELITRRFFSIGFYPNWFYRLTPQGREHDRLLTLMHSFTSKVIKDRRKEIEEEDEADPALLSDSMGLKKRRAFLDLMLIAAKEGAELSDMDIRNEVDTFMFEGHDTTASALVWFLYCMGTNPEHQELVHQELGSIFGGSDRPCTMQDAAQLKYLECCIKESLRLYPSVPGVKRYFDEDFELGGYRIPAGTSISLLILGLHRNEEYFPDPLVYKPERFLNDQAAGRHPFAFIPFSAGPRNCIGQRFAMLEEKVVLSTLLRRFRFRYDTAMNGPAIPCIELVLKPKHGMPLIVSLRK